MLNRRGFLGMLAGAAVAPTILVPERTIFLPPAGGWPTGYAGALAASMRDTKERIAAYTYRTYALGFAVVKGEGEPIVYDELERTMPELHEKHRRALMRGLQEVFDG